MAGRRVMDLKDGEAQIFTIETTQKKFGMYTRVMALNRKVVRPWGENRSVRSLIWYCLLLRSGILHQREAGWEWAISIWSNEIDWLKVDDNYCDGKMLQKAESFDSSPSQTIEEFNRLKEIVTWQMKIRKRETIKFQKNSMKEEALAYVMNAKLLSPTLLSGFQPKSLQSSTKIKNEIHSQEPITSHTQICTGVVHSNGFGIQLEPK